MREADTKGHTVWFHSQEVLEESDLETGSRWWGQELGEGTVSLFHGDRVSVWEDEKILEVGRRMVARQCECI